MNATDHIGVGLWTMQSTATAPTNSSSAYARFAQDCGVLDGLGFHSVWTAEHRAWYDGWCPALIHAQAFAAASTKDLRFGNAMLLLPQHDPVALARSVNTLNLLTGGRVELGVGLGHRDAEFDSLGIRRDQRGRRMDTALETMSTIWSDAMQAGPGPVAPPRIWIGGMSEPAIARAARGNHGLMLPQTLRGHEIERIVGAYMSQAECPAPLGAMRDVWVEPDRARAERFRMQLTSHYREEAGSWWILKGEPGFRRPKELDKQMGRVTESALVGPAEMIAAGLDEMFALGIELVVLRLQFDFVAQADMHAQLHTLAREVLPLLTRLPQRTASEEALRRTG